MMLRCMTSHHTSKSNDGSTIDSGVLSDISNCLHAVLRSALISGVENGDIVIKHSGSVIHGIILNQTFLTEATNDLSSCVRTNG